MPIDTLSNVKLCLCISGSTDDTLLAQIQTAADSFVEAYCQRTFLGGTFTEFHPGGATVLFLRNYPVAAISSVRVDASRQFDPSTAIDPTRFVLHTARGVVECLDGPFIPSLPGWDVPSDAFPAAVRVEYTTATSDVPPVVCRAYAELVGHWYRMAKTAASAGHLNLVESPGTGGQTVYPWKQATGYSVPPGVKELLRPFRVPAA